MDTRTRTGTSASAHIRICRCIRVTTSTHTHYLHNQDAQCVVIRDIYPAATQHFLVISKQHISNWKQLTPAHSQLGMLSWTVVGSRTVRQYNSIEPFHKEQIFKNDHH